MWFEEHRVREWYEICERTNADDIELKAALEQLLLDLGGDGVEADVALGEDAGLLLGVHRRHVAGLGGLDGRWWRWTRRRRGETSEWKRRKLGWSSRNGGGSGGRRRWSWLLARYRCSRGRKCQGPAQKGVANQTPGIVPTATLGIAPPSNSIHCLSHIHNHYNGNDTSSVTFLPLRVPARRTRATFPPRATPPTDTSHAANPATEITSESTTCGIDPNTDIIGRALGWHSQRCTEEEDESYEEEAQTNGRESVEGCHGIEQVQRVWETEESACAMSVLREEYVQDTANVVERIWLTNASRHQSMAQQWLQDEGGVGSAERGTVRKAERGANSKRGEATQVDGSVR